MALQFNYLADKGAFVHKGRPVGGGPGEIKGGVRTWRTTC